MFTLLSLIDNGRHKPVFTTELLTTEQLQFVLNLFVVLEK